MITHDLIQGSDTWHAYRNAHDNASDAPAMMGCSPYKSREQLLAERAAVLAAVVACRDVQRLDRDGLKITA